MHSKPEKARPGLESVWDYPRPPQLVDSQDRVEVMVGDQTIADSIRSKRVLETSHPPVYYIPPQDIRMEFLLPVQHRSFCEWKGQAGYYSVVVPGCTVERAGWYYPEPTPRFTGIRGYVAFYPSKMDACFVDKERVRAQDGDFYGGWITSNIVGPFKGAPGTMGW